MTAIVVRLDRYLPAEKSTIPETTVASSNSIKRPLAEENATDDAQPETDGSLD